LSPKGRRVIIDSLNYRAYGQNTQPACKCRSQLKLGEGRRISAGSYVSARGMHGVWSGWRRGRDGGWAGETGGAVTGSLPSALRGTRHGLEHGGVLWHRRPSRSLPCDRDAQTGGGPRPNGPGEGRAGTAIRVRGPRGGSAVRRRVFATRLPSNAPLQPRSPTNKDAAAKKMLRASEEISNSRRRL
jgi:hypothetical protein